MPVTDNKVALAPTPRALFRFQERITGAGSMVNSPPGDWIVIPTEPDMTKHRVWVSMEFPGGTSFYGFIVFRFAGFIRATVPLQTFNASDPLIRVNPCFNAATISSSEGGRNRLTTDFAFGGFANTPKPFEAEACADEVALVVGAARPTNTGNSNFFSSIMAVQSQTHW